jgi:hypothetical protein
MDAVRLIANDTSRSLYLCSVFVLVLYVLACLDAAAVAGTCSS